MTRECFRVLSIIMISQYDDLTGKDADVQNFLKMIKEKNSEEGMEGILDRMSPTGKKVQNFLGGGQQQMTAMHDYQKDPEIIKNINEIIHNPLFDKDSRTEAQRQLLRINQGLPRFP